MKRSIDTLRVGIALTLFAALVLVLQQFTPWRLVTAIPTWLATLVAALSLILLLAGRTHPRARVALVAAALLLSLAGMAMVGSDPDPATAETSWRDHSARRISEVLIAVGKRIDSLQGLSAGIGERIQSFMTDNEDGATSDPDGWQLDLFRMLGDEAARITQSGRLPRGTEIGIQLLDVDGERIAWAGWPQQMTDLDNLVVARLQETFYTRQVSLYQILTHVIPMRDASGDVVASVIVDLPIEVNYRVNNRFLSSTSVAQDFAAAAAADVNLDYFASATEILSDADRPEQSLTPDTLFARYPFPDYIKPQGRISGDTALGLAAAATVSSRLGNRLLNIRVNSPPILHFLGAQTKNRRVTARALLILAVTILFGLLLRRFPTRLCGPLDVFKALYVAGFVVLVRYMLLGFQPDKLIFDPAIFATPILGGVMRSAGDLLITSILFVGALYGVLKVTRDAARRSDVKAQPTPWLFAVKGAFAALVLLGVVELVQRFVTNVVVNANPRLVGETMSVTEPQTLILQLSAFLMIAGIMLGGLILIWGVYRLRGRQDAVRASLLAAAILLIAGPLVSGWQVTISCVALLLFLFFAPRVVQREDLVSIVIVAFGFVIIVSAAAYTFLNDNYQNLRRTFIQEKVTELTHPSDNWKVFILEDVLETFAKDAKIRQLLRSGEASEMQRLAFDLWAASPLSLLGYSSAIHVFDESDSLVSRFTVEMPYRVRLADTGERLETSSSQEWVVLDLTTNTPSGVVRFYRGIVNISDYVSLRDGIRAPVLSGKVVVDIPFHFENLTWAARTGPQAPEVLRNVQEGGISPRVEETEALLLARSRGARVLESSSDILPVGFRFPDDVFERALGLDWPLLETSGPTYRFFVQELETPGNYLLAGFPVPNPMQHVLRWSTILSLYFFFAVLILLAIVLLKGIPLLREALPSLTPGRQLGFQQKLLGSFLIVALLPAVFLGVFSVGIIKQRFEEESRKEAIYKSFGAYKSIANLVTSEMNYFFDHGDLPSLLAGGLPAPVAGDANRVLGVLDEDGNPLGVGENWPLAGLLDAVSTEEIFVHENGGVPFVGIVSAPFNVFVEDRRRTLHLFYGRRLDAELLGEVADQVGADVNVFDAGELAASSREGLLSGGLISAMMNAEAFVKVSLMDVDQSLVTETAGEYRYEVAYLPIASARQEANAAIGVPLLFRPESYHVEVQKANSVVLSIFALLSAATIGLGLLLARGIFEPLRGLLEGTKRIARGDLSFKLRAKRGDEIGTVVTAFNEMTERLSESQAALEERRRYLEVILANIATGVISTDAEDRVQSVNDAAEKIVGASESDLANRTSSELAAAGIMPQFFSLMAEGARNETPFGEDEVEVAKAGHKRTIKYMRTRLSNEGRYLGSVYVFDDLTELINSKKLSAWVEMSRQIAHEIKNPLTPIKLSAQFMVRAHQEKSQDFDRIFQESSDTIIHQVEVLRRIASEFSSFGRMQRLDVKPHTIATQIEEIVKPYRQNTEGTEITLQVADPSAQVMADEEAVRKICTNLIENAMEAMPEGGHLDISCDEAQVNGRKLIRVSFRDSGPGLNETAKEKLFEPYFSTKTTGTGLGLAICRSLSREMGGDVEVENIENGRGVEAVLMLQRV